MANGVLESPARVLSTMEHDGSRRWLTPRLAKGRLLTRRRWVAYGLIVLLTALPLISINGRPAVLLDVPSRQFTLLGYTFLPTDTILFALLLVSWFATIFLTTAIVGRAWCGWTCPQTVYMEFVYRPIERLFLGRAGTGGKPRANLSSLRYVGLHIAFVLISLIITHTLLSYFVGADQLRRWVVSNPADHPWAFIVIVISTAAVWFNFVFFREQMCIIACPYGRFQSVLFDKHSIGVRYNEPRGEPRAKLQSKRAAIALPTLNPAAKHAGDCIDCSMCVQVCPTGIDIRDGVQLECVNCTQCIDACNNVMRKIGRPEGLIGFYSQVELEGGPTRVLRPRVVLYGIVSIGFLVLMLLLIVTKQPFDASLARNYGLPFFVTPQGKIENTMRLTLRNRTHNEQTFTLAAGTPGVTLLGETTFSVPAGESVVKPVNLVVEPDTLASGKTTATILIQNNQHAARSVQCQLFGPGVRQ